LATIHKKNSGCLRKGLHIAPTETKTIMSSKPASNPGEFRSKKNLTRFDYANSAFEGWRLSLSRAGTTFTRYFPDKKLGGPKKALALAEKTLVELKDIVETSKRVDGKLTPATIRKAEKLLTEAF
jgi:hypothetical protein